MFLRLSRMMRRFSRVPVYWILRQGVAINIEIRVVKVGFKIGFRFYMISRFRSVLQDGSRF